MNSNQRFLLYFFIICLKIFLSYILVNRVYELHRDEYLHLDQASHLAWGYTSVPPFTSWIALLIQISGGGKFWVMFFPALTGAFTIIAAMEIARRIGGGAYAILLTALALLLSALLRINQLFQPNSVDILAWTLIFYFAVVYVKTGTPRNLYFLGIVIGLGFLNKYTVVFLCLGLLPAFLLTPQRKLLAEKHFYFALLLAVVIMSPNIYWQFRHDGPVFKHMQELRETQLVNVNPIDFLKDQLLFFINSSFFWIPALVAFFIYKPFKPYRFIAFTYFTVVAIFLLLKAKSYYAIGLYPTLVAFGAVYPEGGLKRAKQKVLYAVPPVLVGALFFPLLIAFPIDSPKAIASDNQKYKDLGLLRWEDGKDHEIPQDFADMIGWKEMAEIVKNAYLSIPEGEREATLIVCDNYGQAGAVNYYSRGRLPQAVAFNADYVHWFPPLTGIKHFIVVGEKSSDEDIARFKSFKPIGVIKTPYARENGTEVFLLSYPNKEMIRLLEERLKEMQ